MEQRAFTLFEIMIVIAVVAILWGIGFNKYSGSISRWRDSQRMTHIKEVDGILRSISASEGAYPWKDTIQEKLRTGIGHTIKDPINGAQKCMESAAGHQSWCSFSGAKICQYEYAQCANGGGYMIRLGLESHTNRGFYLNDDISWGAQALPFYHEIGDCSLYPEEEEWVVLE